MLAVLAIVTAVFAAPEFGEELVGVVDTEGQVGAGVRVFVGLPVTGVFVGEVDGEVGATLAGAYATGRAGVRLWAPLPRDGTIGLFVGGGMIAFDDSFQSITHIGLAVQPREIEVAQWRVDVGADVGVLGVVTGRVGVGVVVRPPKREPVPRRMPAAQPAVESAVEERVVPPVVTEPETDRAALVVDPEDALVWIPHPVCAWAPAAESGPLLERYGGELPVQVRAPGYLPAIAGEEGEALVLEEAPEQGAVVIVGWPGDQIQLDSASVDVGDDGVAVATAAPGPVSVTVMGSGRSTSVEAYVGDGYALWLRLPEPESERVLFGPNSASLSTSASGQIRRWAETLAGGRLRVAGGSSPEGNAEANSRLANRRAKAVIDALVALGVPSGQLEIGTPEVAGGPSGPQQRRVTITPLTGVL